MVGATLGRWPKYGHVQRGLPYYSLAGRRQPMSRVAILVGLLIAMSISGCIQVEIGPTADDTTADAPTRSSESEGAAQDTGLRTLERDCATDEEFWLAFERFHDVSDSLEVPHSASLEGRMHGEIGTGYIAIDSAAEQARLRFSFPSTDFDLRIDGSSYSVETPTTSGYGRDYDAGANIAWVVDMMDETLSDPASTTFLDRLTFEDYEAACDTYQGEENLWFQFDGRGVSHAFWSQGTSPFNPVFETVVDRASDDDYRVSFDFDRVQVDVDDRLPRLPLTSVFTLEDAYENARGGLYLSGTLTSESESAPLEDIDVLLVDANTGHSYTRFVLEDGNFDLEDGDAFAYFDRDRDGLISAGDGFWMDLAPGLDITFYDTWADAEVDLRSDDEGTPTAPPPAEPAPQVADAELVLKGIYGTRASSSSDVRWLNLTVAVPAGSTALDMRDLAIYISDGATEASLVHATADRPGAWWVNSASELRDDDQSWTATEPILTEGDLVNIRIDLGTQHMPASPGTAYEVAIAWGESSSLLADFRTPSSYGDDTIIILR